MQQAPEKMGITTKFSYPAILFELVKGLTLQSMKLPHELVDKDIGVTGTTTKDIVESVVRGVEMLHSTLDPYFDDTFRQEYASVMENGEKINSDSVWAVYRNAMEHLACLFRLMDRKRMLLTEDMEDIMDEVAGDVVYGDEAVV